MPAPTLSAASGVKPPANVERRGTRLARSPQATGSSSERSPQGTVAVVCGPLAARKQFWGLSKRRRSAQARHPTMAAATYGQRYAFQSGPYLGHRPSVLGRKFGVGASSRHDRRTAALPRSPRAPPPLGLLGAGHREGRHQPDRLAYHAQVTLLVQGPASADKSRGETPLGALQRR